LFATIIPGAASASLKYEAFEHDEQRRTHEKMNGRNDLPNHSSAVEEKLLHKSHASLHTSWTRPLYLPIPGVRTRRLRILIPNFSFLFPGSNRGSIIIGSSSSPALFPAGGASRIMLVKRRRTPLLVVLATLAIFFTFATLLRGRGSQSWVEEGTSEPSTLVFRRKELQKIWEWEIESGHYPSHASSACFFSLLN
jgi:WD repeat and SOF domain-containing protein 1